MPLVRVSNGGSSEITVVNPSISSGNSYSISYSGLEIGSQLALCYYLTSSDLNTIHPTVTGATVLYDDFYNYTNHIKMILQVNSANVKVSGTKHNTAGFVGASWQIS